MKEGPVLMKAAIATGGAGIDAVTIRDVPMPSPAPGEALVRLKAATLNFRDLLAADGLVPGLKEPGYVPLSCGAGEVVAVGDGVTRVKPGDRVSPLFAQGWLSGPKPAMAMLGGPVDGVARTHGAFDAESLCLTPDQLGDLEAATLPCAGLTAWSALFGPRPIAAGEWVLVQGTGGVSLAALQWAKAAGANVVVTSSSEAKLRRARALGADILINYRTTPDWAMAARAALGGRGVDILVDVVGSAGLETAATMVEDGLSPPAYRRAAKLADGFIFGGDLEKSVLRAWQKLQGFLAEEARAVAGFGADYQIPNGTGVQDTLDMIRRWQDAGGTHVAVRTMGLGFTATQQHVDHLAEVRGLLG